MASATTRCFRLASRCGVFVAAGGVFPVVAALAPTLRANAISCVSKPLVAGVATAQGAHYGTTGTPVIVRAAAPGLFGKPGLAPSAAVGQAWVASSQIAVAADGGSLSFPLPAHASGAVAVTLSGASCEVSNTNYNFVSQPSASLPGPVVLQGSTLQVRGSGFAPFGPGGLRSAAVWGSYSGCSQVVSAAVVSDSSLTVPVPNVSCNGQLDLTFTAAYNTAGSDPPIVMGVDAGNLAVTQPVSAVAPSAPSLPGMHHVSVIVPAGQRVSVTPGTSTAGLVRSSEPLAASPAHVLPDAAIPPFAGIVVQPVLPDPAGAMGATAPVEPWSVADGTGRWGDSSVFAGVLLIGLMVTLGATVLGIHRGLIPLQPPQAEPASVSWWRGVRWGRWVGLTGR